MGAGASSVPGEDDRGVSNEVWTKLDRNKSGGRKLRKKISKEKQKVRVSGISNGKHNATGVGPNGTFMVY